VDKALLSSSDTRERQKYIEELKDKFQKDMVLKEQPMIMVFPQYLEQEKEKTDLFLFMRIFCPSLYKSYVMVSPTKD
jgi:hypothetical protein